MNIDYVHHDTKTFDEEKFMEEFERRYIKNHTTHIKGYTEEYVNKLNQQITQLTNNWNELEEWLKEGTEELPYINGDMYWREACENVLDKMTEIKERKNERRFAKDNKSLWHR